MIILEIYCALFTQWLDVSHSPASIQLSNSTKPSENITHVFKFVYAHRDINIRCVCEFTSLVQQCLFCEWHMVVLFLFSIMKCCLQWHIQCNYKIVLNKTKLHYFLLCHASFILNSYRSFWVSLSISVMLKQCKWWTWGQWIEGFVNAFADL